MARKQLIEYLPEIIKQFEEMQQIMQAEQPQIDKLWTAIYEVLDNAFIETEGEVGASRWESILDIKPLDTDSIKVRNFRIRARLLEDIPYTWRTFNGMLSALCGKDGYTIKLNNDEYTLIIKVALTSKALKNEVIKLSERVVPLNLILDIDLMYNTHEMLRPFTHRFLSSYTHNQIREEPY